MNISHFHKFQNRQESYDHLHTGRLFGQKLAKTEFTMLRGISFHGQHFVRKTDFFFFNRTEFTSNRVNLGFLTFQNRLIDAVQLLESKTLKEFGRIYRLSVFQNFARQIGCTEKNTSRIIHIIFQFVGHVLVHFIFKKFLNEFFSRILFFSFIIRFFRKKHFAFNVKQGCSHDHKFTHGTEVFFFHRVQILHILVSDLDDRDVIYVNFVFFDEVKEKIKRTFKYVDFNGNCHFRVPFCFGVDFQCAFGQEQDRQESVPAGYGCGLESCVLQVRH